MTSFLCKYNDKSEAAKPQEGLSDPLIDGYGAVRTDPMRQV